MNKLYLFILSSLLTFGLSAQKTRILITTDLGQDPDDQQSLIRLLHYTDVLEIEGLILNADSNNNYEAPVLGLQLADTLLTAYEQTYKSFSKYGDFTVPHILRNKLKKGSTKNSVFKPIDSYLGTGFSTQGSDWIIQKTDESTFKKPLHICLWGGGVDLAQALWKVRNSRSLDELNKFIEKIKVYSITKQDTSIDWMIENFPQLYLVLSDNPESSWKASFRGMFLGGDMNNTSKTFFEENIINENPLTKLYPRKTHTGSNPHGFMKEGDSPSFLFFIKTGLNDNFQPNYGSWGGRFTSANNYLWTDTTDSLNLVANDAISTVSRWRAAFQADFIMRVKWGNPQYVAANLPPVTIANSKLIKSHKGKKYLLDASKSYDPNEENLRFHWWIYKEPSSYKASIVIEDEHSPITYLIISKDSLAANIGEVHVILEVIDVEGVTRYKRLIIEI